MDRLKAMKIFVEVARQEGFATAGRQLGMSTSAVSRYIMDMEKWLDVQLLNRTTRHLSLTDSGKHYLERSKTVLKEVREMEQSAKSVREAPQGELRVSAPVFVGKYFLGSILPAFFERYPGISVRLHLRDRFVDLIEEGFDLALRIGELEDSTLVARRLSSMRLMLAAAPSYIDQYGKPETVDDLKNHNCIIDTVAKHGDRWPLKHKGGFRVHGNLSVNNGELVRDVALAGLGIARLPDFFVAQDIEEGTLVSLLSDIKENEVGIYAVYSQARHLSSSIRALIDFMLEHLNVLSSVG